MHTVHNLDYGKITWYNLIIQVDGRFPYLELSIRTLDTTLIKKPLEKSILRKVFNKSCKYAVSCEDRVYKVDLQT